MDAEVNALRKLSHNTISNSTTQKIELLTAVVLKQAVG